MKLQGAGTVGLRTVVLYFFTSICASIQAVIVYAAFKPALFQLQPDQESATSYIAMQCGNGRYFAEDPITRESRARTDAATG